MHRDFTIGLSKKLLKKKAKEMINKKVSNDSEYVSNGSDFFLQYLTCSVI